MGVNVHRCCKIIGSTLFYQKFLALFSFDPWSQIIITLEKNSRMIPSFNWLSLLLSFIFSTTQTPATQKGLQLVWHDEFDGRGLPDSSKWSYDVGGHGWGNNELQFYTAGRKENAHLENGRLIIEAVRKDREGKNYTSARLVTRGKGDWQFGRVEVRAKIPRGRGTWPAIWMLASTTDRKWPDDGEIDIMEHVGYDQGRIHATVHCKKYNHIIGTQKSAQIMLPDCSDNFHVYAVNWNKDSVEIAVDGKPYYSFTNDGSGYDSWPFDNKMHLILNIAVGGNWGGSQGVDTTIWPQRMEVDYVRVYQ
jgi:beta-glucanase (GH16 family)